MPDLFGAAEMSFKNAFGLILLCSTIAAFFHSGATKRRVKPVRRTDDELEECFCQNGFRFAALPDQNGAVFYFTATN